MERIYILELVSELMPSSARLQTRSLLGYYSSFSMAEEAACCFVENGISSLHKDLAKSSFEPDIKTKQFLQSYLGQISSLEKCDQVIQELMFNQDMIELRGNHPISNETKQFFNDVLGIKQSFEWFSSLSEKRMFSITEHAVDEQARIR